MNLLLKQFQWCLEEFEALESSYQTQLDLNETEVSSDQQIIARFLSNACEEMRNHSTRTSIQATAKTIGQKDEEVYWALNRLWPNHPSVSVDWLERYKLVSDRLNMLRHAK